MNAKQIILVLLILIFVVILLQNTQVVTLQILFWKVTMSRVIFIPVILVIGFIIGFLVAKLYGRKKKEKT